MVVLNRYSRTFICINAVVSSNFTEVRYKDSISTNAEALIQKQQATLFLWLLPSIATSKSARFKKCSHDVEIMQQISFIATLSLSNTKKHIRWLIQYFVDLFNYFLLLGKLFIYFFFIEYSVYVTNNLFRIKIYVTSVYLCFE